MLRIMSKENEPRKRWGLAEVGGAVVGDFAGTYGAAALVQNSANSETVGVPSHKPQIETGEAAADIGLIAGGALVGAVVVASAVHGIRRVAQGISSVRPQSI